MEDDTCSFGRLERNQVMASELGQWRGIEINEFGAAANRSPEALSQWTAMSTWLSEQTAVVDRCVLEREPQPDHADWIGVEKGGVLMGTDLTADPWVLEDLHRLKKFGVNNPKVADKLGERVLTRESREDRIKVVLSVTEFVECHERVDGQLTVLIERFVLPEEFDPISGTKKATVGDSLLLLGAKDGTMAGRIEG